MWVWTCRLGLHPCLWSTLPGTLGCVTWTFCSAVSLSEPSKGCWENLNMLALLTQKCVPELSGSLWVIPWDLHSPEGHALSLPCLHLGDRGWQSDGGHDCSATSSRVWSITAEVWALSRIWAWPHLPGHTQSTRSPWCLCSWLFIGRRLWKYQRNNYLMNNESRRSLKKINIIREGLN